MVAKLAVLQFAASARKVVITVGLGANALNIAIYQQQMQTLKSMSLKIVTVNPMMK